MILWVTMGVAMRGKDESSLFSYVDLEARVPRGHPLRAIRDLTNAALAEMSGAFEALYWVQVWHGADMALVNS